MKAIIKEDIIASNRNPNAWYDPMLNNKVIEFNSILELKEKLEELIREEYFINNKSLKFTPIYRGTDNKKIGFATSFNTDIEGKKIYFETWLELLEIKPIDFKNLK